jgi:hypothetical protein
MIFNEIYCAFLSILSINVECGKSTKGYKIPKRVCNFVKHSFVYKDIFVHFGCNIYLKPKNQKFQERTWQKL